MEQIGFVRKVENEKMELEVRRGSAWGGGCKDCSSSCEEAPHILVLPNELGAKVGDFVQLQAQVGNLLKYTFILYMIPFIFLILGIVIGNYLSKGLSTDSREMFSFISGLVSVGISLVILKIMDKKAEKKEDDTITAIKIL